jgi:hypothetical protein
VSTRCWAEVGLKTEREIVGDEGLPGAMLSRLHAYPTFLPEMFVFRVYFNRRLTSDRHAFNSILTIRLDLGTRSTLESHSDDTI